MRKYNNYDNREEMYSRGIKLTDDTMAIGKSTFKGKNVIIVNHYPCIKVGKQIIRIHRAVADIFRRIM